VTEKLEIFTSNMGRMADYYRREGVLPDVKAAKPKKEGFLSTIRKIGSAGRKGTASSTDNSDSEGAIQEV